MNVKTRLLTALCGTGFLLLSTFCVSGADSTFSKDSKHVYLVHWRVEPPKASGACSLIDVNLEKMASSGIDLTTTIKEELVAITLANNGHVLCATKSALWSYDPDKGGCEKILDAPKDVEIETIAYDPTQNILFAQCWGGKEQVLFSLQDASNQWVPVFNRRSALVDAPVFGDDGSLYFSSQGDLWAGSLKRQTQPTAPALYQYSISFDPKKWPQSIQVAELTAHRFAPVASLETQNTTSGSTGLLELAVSKRFIYGDYARMGGTGWGAVIRCIRSAPAKKKTDGDKSLQMPGDNGKEAIPILQSIETVSNEPCYYLCASRDGSLVFYVEHGQPFLVRDEAKPEKLVIDGLKDLL